MKTIAERFEEQAAYEGVLDAHDQSIFIWLEQQPENKQMFTLEQVEAIAREAVRQAEKFCNPSTEELDDVDFNESWWINKLKELEGK